MNKPTTHSDLAKLDAHVIGQKEYEEIPELTETDFAQGVVQEGGSRAARGRPPSLVRKKQVTLRLDQDVVDGFRETGPGWQGRINDVLKYEQSLIRARQRLHERQMTLAGQLIGHMNLETDDGLPPDALHTEQEDLMAEIKRVDAKISMHLDRIRRREV